MGSRRRRWLIRSVIQQTDTHHCISPSNKQPTPTTSNQTGAPDSRIAWCVLVMCVVDWSKPPTGKGHVSPWDACEKHARTITRSRRRCSDTVFFSVGAITIRIVNNARYVAALVYRTFCEKTPCESTTIDRRRWTQSAGDVLRGCLYEYRCSARAVRNLSTLQLWINEQLCWIDNILSHAIEILRQQNFALALAVAWHRPCVLFLLNWFGCCCCCGGRPLTLTAGGQLRMGSSQWWLHDFSIQQVVRRTIIRNK